MPIQNARVKFGPAATWTVGEALNQHAEHRREGHRHDHHQNRGKQRRADPLLNGPAVGDVIAHERAEHIDITMSEIDQPQNAVNHRVAEGDQA
jgi:hypothetical protein